MPTWLLISGLKACVGSGCRCAWIKDACDIIPDAEARKKDSERRRIEVIMMSVMHGTPAANALAGYSDKLIGRVKTGKSTLRSVRLALRPATSLLFATEVSGAKLQDQTALNCYLLEAPGQKAAITGFVNFLNDKCDLALVPKVDAKHVIDMRRKKLETELVALVCEGGGGEDFRLRWLSVALAYFHGLPRNVRKKIHGEQITVHGYGGIAIDWNGQKYWIPEFGAHHDAD